MSNSETGNGDPTNDRKLEHINIIRNDPATDRRRHYFDDIQLTHRALPELNFSEVDTTTQILGKPLQLPLLISSMTGGQQDLIQRVNQNLAEAAEATGIAMAVGSQRVMFTHPAARKSFELRKYAPNTVLISNLGAVQFNLGFGLDECQAAIDAIGGDEASGADGLYMHLNPLQEAIQPEGDTDFSGLTAKMKALSDALEVPVLAKEVGAGLSRADGDRLLAAGIQHLDVAGSGGTSWSRIEHFRDAKNESANLGLLFQDWGIPTPLALKQLAPLREQGATLIASGGIRNGIDMAKAMILGADLCGMAGPFLEPAIESSEAVIRMIHQVDREFRTAMFLLGAGDINSLTGNTDLLT